MQRYTRTIQHMEPLARLQDNSAFYSLQELARESSKYSYDAHRSRPVTIPPGAAPARPDFSASRKNIDYHSGCGRRPRAWHNGGLPKTSSDGGALDLRQLEQRRRDPARHSTTSSPRFAATRAAQLATKINTGYFAELGEAPGRPSTTTWTLRTRPEIRRRRCLRGYQAARRPQKSCWPRISVPACTVTSPADADAHTLQDPSRLDRVPTLVFDEVKDIGR